MTVFLQLGFNLKLITNATESLLKFNLSYTNHIFRTISSKDSIARVWFMITRISNLFRILVMKEFFNYLFNSIKRVKFSLRILLTCSISMSQNGLLIIIKNGIKKIIMRVSLKWEWKIQTLINNLSQTEKNVRESTNKVKKSSSNLSIQIWKEIMRCLIQ